MIKSTHTRTMPIAEAWETLSLQRELLHDYLIFNKLLTPEQRNDITRGIHEIDIWKSEHYYQYAKPDEKPRSNGVDAGRLHV